MFSTSEGKAHLVRTFLLRWFNFIIPPIHLWMRDNESATTVLGQLIHKGAKRVRFGAIFGSCSQGLRLLVKFLPTLRRAQYMRRHNPMCFHPVNVRLRYLLCHHLAAVKFFRTDRIHFDDCRIDSRRRISCDK